MEENANKPKYMMRLSIHVLEHLGFNLYSSIPAVISEVVANAWDADATEVKIITGGSSIEIIDNGNGMSLDDINNKYLLVGFKKRDFLEDGLSPVLKRPVMGRKGIGKLSLFSIAEKIEIHTVTIAQNGSIAEKNGFLIRRSSIKKAVAPKPESSVYSPEIVDPITIGDNKGTRIILSELDKRVAGAIPHLRRRLARRFSVLGKNFSIILDGTEITLADRDYYKNLQFLWTIGTFEDSQIRALATTLKAHENLDGTLKVPEETGFSEFQISGWIGTVKEPGDLEDASDGKSKSTNNKISLVVRGKMAQEDLLKNLNESGIFANYIIGEIHADELDSDTKDDISTSNRQSIKEDDPRYVALLDHLGDMLKKIKRKWGDMRVEESSKSIVRSIELDYKPVFDWYNSLKGDDQKAARDLLSTIDSLHFDKENSKSKKRELFKYGILAFERLKFKNQLSLLKDLDSISFSHMAPIFSDVSDLEAASYYDIASGRIEVIHAFSRLVDANEREKVLQKYLFDHLWLLDPSWARGTSPDKRMEETVYREFQNINAALTIEEKNARLDIRYKTSGARHVIIELKRYRPSYTISIGNIYDQLEKYRNALVKCLNSSGESDPYIELIVILGPGHSDKEKTINGAIQSINGKVKFYDDLINSALKAYSEYLEANEKYGKIRQLLAQL